MFASPPPPSESRRSILLAGQAVDYTLRRSRRRSIGLSIDQRGLRVGAPLRARLGDIEKLLQEHAQWVLDKLNSWRERPPLPTFAAEDGRSIEILGQARQIVLRPATRARTELLPEHIRLDCPPARPAIQLLETLLRQQARLHFAARLAHFAPRLGVAPPPLRLSSAKTRWGSCNARGQIALNWRLLLLPPEIVDYVVCHELAHLREMNHSPRFWAVVETLCPDWRALRLALRQRGRQLPHW